MTQRRTLLNRGGEGALGLLTCASVQAQAYPVGAITRVLTLQAKNIKVDTHRELVPVAGIANIPTA
jgi:hypothetical protein